MFFLQMEDIFHRDFKLSLIHISEPTRRTPISYAVFCLKKKKLHLIIEKMAHKTKRTSKSPHNKVYICTTIS